MNATRYFKGPLSFWKFEGDSHPQVRTPMSSEWMDSVFRSLTDFLADPEPVLEVTAKEAEGERVR